MRFLRLIVIGLLAPLAAHAAIGTPVALTAGTSTTSPLTLSVAVSTGDLLVVSADWDTTRTLTSVTWNGTNMTQDVLLTFHTVSKHLVASLYITSGATANLVITLSGNANIVANPMRITGIVSSAWTDKTASAATGFSTSPSSGATAALSQANEIGIGALGADGASTISGTWSNSFTNLQTAAVSTNEVNQTSYLIVSATTALTAQKTSTASLSYAAAIVTYKGASGTAKVCTVSLMGAGVC